MATALDIIKGSMRLLGALEAGATPSGEDTTDALAALNDLLEQLSLERLMIYEVARETFAWPSGQASRTIGATGQLVTGRPERLEDGCFIRDSNGYDYPLRLENLEQYQRHGIKTQPGIPASIFYSPGFPNGTLYLYPVPDASMTLGLASLKAFTSFALPSTSVSLPPGYKRMLQLNLAVVMAPEWIGRDAKATIQQQARDAKGAVARMNIPRPHSRIDSALSRRSGSYNILTDGYP